MSHEHRFEVYCPDMGRKSMRPVFAHNADEAAEQYARLDAEADPWDGDFLIVYVLDDLHCEPALWKSFQVDRLDDGEMRADRGMNP